MHLCLLISYTYTCYHIEGNRFIFEFDIRLFEVRFLLFLRQFLYSFSNHALSLMITRMLSYPVLIQTQLRGIFYLKYPKMPFKFQRLKHNYLVSLSKEVWLSVVRIEVLFFLVQYQHFRVLDLMPCEQIILYFALTF